MTNNYSKASLTEAVKDKVEAIKSFKAGITKPEIETRVSTYLSSVFTNLTVDSVEVTLPNNSTQANDAVTVVVTASDSVVGSISVTAQIVIQE